jgi:DNA-directed RNA polymerase specialized sigma24 family protein
LRANQEDARHWRDMMRELNALPAAQRAVLLLVSVENLSYAEVARVLDIPIGTVMSRLARARERLRQHTGRESQPAVTAGATCLAEGAPKIVSDVEAEPHLL